MPDYKAQVVLPCVTGLARDNFVNDFSFSGAGVTLGLALTALIDFYTTDNTSGGGANALGEYLSGRVSRAADSALVKIYQRVPGGPDGPPVASQTFTVPTCLNPSVNYPSEVAAVISLTAGTGSNMRRRRGRVFFGPFTIAAMTVDTSVEIVRDLFITDALIAAARLKTELTTAGARWDVWSSADNVGREVTVVSVDNAPDTQRRRGPRATARTSVSV